MAYHYYCYYYH